MNISDFGKKFAKLVPEPLLIRKTSSSLKLLPPNDPFKHLSTKFPNNFVLKPTCHRSFNIEKSFFSPKDLEKKTFENSG